MTTFVSKTADFAGGRLVDYDCPIPDARVCSWLGGSLEDATRNFGTGAALGIVGAPQIIDELWCRVSGGSFFQTDASRANETTLVAVYRPVGLEPQTGANRPTIIGNEIFVTPERSGLTMYIDQTSIMSTAIQHTNPDNTLTSALPSIPIGARVRTNPLFAISSEERNVDGRSKSRAELFTAPYTALSSNQIASTVLPLNFAQPPFRIGSSNRTDTGALAGPVDVAFVAIIPRKLSDLEKQQLYMSVKRRFAAFGVTI